MRLILFILISFLPGCTATIMQYSYDLLEVHDVEIKEPSPFAEISVQTVLPSVMVIKMENKTDEKVFVDWNQSSINGSPIYSGSLVAGTLRPESGTMPPTVIPKNDYSANIILPMINVKETSVIETFSESFVYTNIGTEARTNSNANAYGTTRYGRSSSNTSAYGYGSSSSTINTNSYTYGYSSSSSTIRSVKDILPIRYPARITLKISQKDKEEYTVVDVMGEYKRTLVCYDGKESYDNFLKNLSEIRRSPLANILHESPTNCIRWHPYQ